MKKRIIKSAIFSIIATATLVLPSCKKYLDVTSPSTISQSVAFSSLSYTNSALIGVYNQLIGDPGYGIRLSLYYPMGGDDFKSSGSAARTDRRAWNIWDWSPDNVELPAPFAQLYVGAERANICVKNIPLSPLYTGGSTSDQATMQKYYGEALTLRAIFYFELVRNWGDVVAQFVPSSDEPVFDVAATDKKVILDQLIKDLQLAETLVPWRTESGYTDTRLTKGAVKGLLARIALFRGGYLLNEATHVDERSSNYLDYYKIAMKECSEIMARRDQHDLNPVYENIFKTLHGSARLDDKYEIMFRVGAFGGNATTDSKIAYYNGIRFNATSSYGATQGGVTAIPTYFYEFDQLGDVRRDVTIGSWQIDANSQKALNALNNQTDAKFRKSWSSITSTTAQNFGIDWPIIRFADILLMYAEADNEVNGNPSAVAQSALKEVRDRAFVGNLTREPVMSTTHDAFFTDIVKERLLEFGGEGIRKYDLIRWHLVAAKKAEVVAKLTALQAGTGAYANVPNYVYAKPGTYLQGTSVNELATIDTYGGAPNTTLFQPGLGTNAVPTGTTYVVINWRASINTANDITSFMQGFVEGSREVMPFATSTLLLNTKLTQKYGY